MKFGFHAIHLPTPKTVKRIGRAFTLAGTAGAGIAFVTNFEQVALACAVAVIVGKFVESLFGEDEQT